MLGVSKGVWDIFCEDGWLLDEDLVLYRDGDVEYELLIFLGYSFFKASNFSESSCATGEGLISLDALPKLSLLIAFIILLDFCWVVGWCWVGRWESCVLKASINRDLISPVLSF